MNQLRTACGWAGLATITVLAACRASEMASVRDVRAEAGAPSAITSASASVSTAAAAPPPMQTVLLATERDLVETQWGFGGEVVALVRGGVLRFPPETDAPARFYALPEGIEGSRLAASQKADVVAVVTTNRQLFVSRAGGPLAMLGRAGGPASVYVSDDGKWVSLDVEDGKFRRAMGVRDATTGAPFRVFETFVTFDPTSRFVASDDRIAPLYGGPDYELHGARFDDWVGDRAALVEKKAVRLYDPRKGDTKRFAVCADEPEIDAEGARAISPCDGGRSLEVVSLVDGTREKSAVPLRPGESLVGVALSRSGKDVLVRVGRVNRGYEVHDQRLLALAPGTHSFHEVPLSTPWRELRYERKLEDVDKAKAQQGRRMLISDRAAWPLRIEAEDGKEVAHWGPADQHEGTVVVRVRDRGLDVMRLPGSLGTPPETMRIRIGSGQVETFDAGLDPWGQRRPLPTDGGVERTAPPMTAAPMFPVRGAWTLEAAGVQARLYSPPPYRWFTNELTTYDVASGRMQTRVLLLTNAAVARYADGTVELFGDEATAARAVRCFDGTLYRPFAACAATARVTGKYTIDL